MDESPRSEYFAYGSNLSLQQMAARCPSSLLKGRAILLDFRWQINQRGVGNIVPSKDHRVEGLVFTIDTEDEKALDRSEGVSRGFYEKRKLTVRLYEYKKATKTAVLARMMRSNQPLNMGPKKEHKIQALVYISFAHTQDGTIREEYIGRMQRGIADAKRFGMSARYAKDEIEPLLQLSQRPREHQPETLEIGQPTQTGETAIQSTSVDNNILYHDGTSSPSSDEIKIEGRYPGEASAGSTSTPPSNTYSARVADERDPPDDTAELHTSRSSAQKLSAGTAAFSSPSINELLLSDARDSSAKDNKPRKGESSAHGPPAALKEAKYRGRSSVNQRESEDIAVGENTSSEATHIADQEPKSRDGRRVEPIHRKKGHSSSSGAVKSKLYGQKTIKDDTSSSEVVQKEPFSSNVTNGKAQSQSAAKGNTSSLGTLKQTFLKAFGGGHS